MYVHIGKELIIPENEIITILDLEKEKVDKILADILFSQEVKDGTNISICSCQSQSN